MISIRLLYFSFFAIEWFLITLENYKGFRILDFYDGRAYLTMQFCYDINVAGLH